MKNDIKKLGLGLFGFLLMIGVAFLYQKNSSFTLSRNESSTSTANTNPSDVVVTSNTGRYKNGTYSFESVYTSPGGQDSLSVNLILVNDVVSTASVTGIAKNPASKGYQDGFISLFKSEVIGKSIDSLNLTVVGGASLTTSAFNKALTDIKTQASV